MIRAPILRAVRAPRAPAQVRLNSSSSTTKQAQEKAADAFGAAQNAAGKGLEQLKSISGSVGASAGNLLGAYKEPLLYNLAVARELAKQVYVREGLAPPTNLSTIQSTYQTLFARARDVNYWKGIAQSGEWAKVAVYGAEAYFIFSIGEMIGRRHIVGYKLD